MTGWDSKLAAAELDFDANLYDFATNKFRRFAGAHDINRDVTPMEPLARLYELPGIAVQIYLLTSVVAEMTDG